ncbi:hypothetical protein B566_EDAN016854 [Ephemera danica]|nr:hypothetical protein B566_EDAN016854 [Ephemera danica]
MDTNPTLHTVAPQVLQELEKCIKACLLMRVEKYIPTNVVVFQIAGNESTNHKKTHPTVATQALQQLEARIKVKVQQAMKKRLHRVANQVLQVKMQQAMKKRLLRVANQVLQVKVQQAMKKRLHRVANQVLQVETRINVCKDAASHEKSSSQSGHPSGSVAGERPHDNERRNGYRTPSRSRHPSGSVSGERPQGHMHANRSRTNSNGSQRNFSDERHDADTNPTPNFVSKLLWNLKNCGDLNDTEFKSLVIKCMLYIIAKLQECGKHVSNKRTKVAADETTPIVFTKVTCIEELLTLEENLAEKSFKRHWLSNEEDGVSPYITSSATCKHIGRVIMNFIFTTEAKLNMCFSGRKLNKFALKPKGKTTNIYEAIAKIFKTFGVVKYQEVKSGIQEVLYKSNDKNTRTKRVKKKSLSHSSNATRSSSSTNSDPTDYVDYTY